MNISVVDSHCHVYPEAIAARAVEGIGSFYNIPMNLDGTVDCLLKRMDEGHIDHAVISSCATRPAQVSPINRFLAEAMQKSGGRLTALGTMHPDSPDQQADFDEILSLGLHGVKMHHDFQRVAVDDPRCYPIYELCSGKVPTTAMITRTPTASRPFCAISRNFGSSARTLAAGRFGKRR